MNAIGFIKHVFRYMKINNDKSYTPKYRVVQIYRDNEDKFMVKLQILGKKHTFDAKPEEILADDKFVDCLHPRDARSLTYLGYLAINQPEYKLLAQQMATNNSEVFLLKKRGSNKPVIKTAAEINQESEIISKMSPDDAKVIGYAMATNNINHVEQQKKEVLKELENKN